MRQELWFLLPIDSPLRDMVCAANEQRMVFWGVLCSLFSSRRPPLWVWCGLLSDDNLSVARVVPANAGGWPVR